MTFSQTVPFSVFRKPSAGSDGHPCHSRLRQHLQTIHSFRQGPVCHCSFTPPGYGLHILNIMSFFTFHCRGIPPGSAAGARDLGERRRFRVFASLGRELGRSGKCSAGRRIALRGSFESRGLPEAAKREVQSDLGCWKVVRNWNVKRLAT